MKSSKKAVQRRDFSLEYKYYDLFIYIEEIFAEWVRNMERIQYDVGDIVKMKKKHPCGSDLWHILRTGMDFGIKCDGCGRFVMLPRPKFEKMVIAIVTKQDGTK